MQKSEDRLGRGLDVFLGLCALVLGIICIPMIFEFSGGSGGRAALLGCMLVPPALGLGWVQWRDASPRAARAKTVRRRRS